VKKIAQELVAVAKLLIAAKPLMLADRDSSKIEGYLADLESFVKVGMIPHARFKDLYGQLTNMWERSCRLLRDEIEKDMPYNMTKKDSPYEKERQTLTWELFEMFNPSITRFPTAVKRLAQYKGPKPELIKTFLDSWEPVYDLLMTAKTLSVKRTQLPTKKDEEQKQREQWLKPHQSSETLTMVRGILEQIIQQHYNELVKSLVDYYTSKAEFFQKTIDDFAKSDILSFYDYRKKNMYPEDSVLIQKFTSFAKPTYGMHDKQEIVFDSTKAFTTLTAMGKEQAEFMREQYIVKNMSKITAVINEKEKASYAAITKHDANGRFGHNIFEGRLDFEFSDGSGFTVINQAVFVINQQRTMFYRYPTTFHHVKFSNGITKAMVPEQNMVQVWSKA